MRKSRLAIKIGISLIVMVFIASCGTTPKKTIKVPSTKKPKYPPIQYIGDTDKMEYLDLSMKNIAKDLGEDYEKYVGKYVKVAGKAEYYTVDNYVLTKEAIKELFGKKPPETPMKYIVLPILSDKKETITIFANSEKYSTLIKDMPFNQKVVVIGKLSGMASKNTFSVIVDE